jgi:hypothetical protein
MNDLLGSYYHCKAHFAVVQDVVSQINLLKDETEFKGILFKGIHSPLVKDENPIFCNFDFAVSDRQDKLIMLRHY